MNVDKLPDYLEFGSLIATFASIPMTLWSGNGWLKASKLKMPVLVEPEKIPVAGRVEIMGRDMADYIPRMETGVARMEAALDVIDEGGRLNAEAAGHAVWAASFIAIAAVLHAVSYFMALFTS